VAGVDRGDLPDRPLGAVQTTDEEAVDADQLPLAARSRGAPPAKVREAAQTGPDSSDSARRLPRVEPVTDERLVDAVGTDHKAAPSRARPSRRDPPRPRPGWPRLKATIRADRVWRTQTQLELVIVEWVAGSTTLACTKRSTTSPAEFEAFYAPQLQPISHAVNEETS
jgi:hypothetical protein